MKLFILMEEGGIVMLILLGFSMVAMVIVCKRLLSKVSSEITDLNLL